MPIPSKLFDLAPLYYPCPECGSFLFKVKMDENWNSPDYPHDDISGQIECAKCGIVFTELGR